MEDHVNSETAYNSNTAEFPFASNALKNVFRWYCAWIIPEDLLFWKKNGRKGKARIFKYELFFLHTQIQAALRSSFQKEILTACHFQWLRWVSALQKAIFSDVLFLWAVGDSCLYWQEFLENFLNMDFIYQPLPRDKLLAMENHSRTVISSTSSQKLSVATNSTQKRG